MRQLRRTVGLCILCAALAVSCVTSEDTEKSVPQEAGEIVAENTPKQKTISITGIPTMYGNEPRSYVVIVAGDRKDETRYFVHPEFQDQLRSMTGNRYHFFGYIYEGEEGFFEARLHDFVFMPESWEPATGN